MAGIGAGIKNAFDAVNNAQKHQELLERQQEKMELAQRKEERLKRAQELREKRIGADDQLINDVITQGEEIYSLKNEINIMRSEIENLKTQISILSTNDMSGFASTADMPYTAGPLNYFPM